MKETTIFHEGLNHKEKDGKGEQLEPALHFNPFFDEQEDNHHSDIHEESHPNFLYEDYNRHVENSTSDVFKEYFILPIYDACKDGYLDHAPQEPTHCNNILDFQEEEEDSKWDISLCFSNSEIILLDSIEEHNDISFETLGRIMF